MSFTCLLFSSWNRNIKVTAWGSYKGFRDKLVISSFLKREKNFWERNLPNWTIPSSEGFENLWYCCTAGNLFPPVLCRAVYKSFMYHTVLGGPASRNGWVLTILIHQQKYCMSWTTEDKDFKPVEEGVLHQQFVFFSSLFICQGIKPTALFRPLRLWTEDCI